MSANLLPHAPSDRERRDEGGNFCGHRHSWTIFSPYAPHFSHRFSRWKHDEI